MTNTKEKAKEIYVDNSATTMLNPEVLDAMLPFLKQNYGNPGSMHEKGIVAKKAMRESREMVARHLGCHPREIIFTGSGTESDNLAVLGYVRANKEKGKHIITTKIEHHAVEECFKELEKEGFAVTYVDVDENGLIEMDRLKDSIRDDTFFMSVIYANNEIGTVQNIIELSKICKENSIVLHTDACQATSYLEIDVNKLGVDLMTINGSKIYGPKGIGVLYKNKKVKINPIIFGGGQEFGYRSGTENIANIVGFAKALDIERKDSINEYTRLEKLRNRLIDGLLKIPDTVLNGDKDKRLPNNVNVSFLNIEGESVLLYLNELGIYASTGSACSSKSLEPSYVILATGRPKEIAHGSIRFSLGKHITEEDIDYILKKMPGVVEHFRCISPLKLKMEDVLAGNIKYEGDPDADDDHHNFEEDEDDY